MRNNNKDNDERYLYRVLFHGCKDSKHFTKVKRDLVSDESGSCYNSYLKIM